MVAVPFKDWGCAGIDKCFPETSNDVTAELLSPGILFVNVIAVDVVLIIAVNIWDSLDVNISILLAITAVPLLTSVVPTVTV
ncbi:hypothetical protein AGMMS50267_01310 [Spirochaetia bacterium]|nr:hypothetical protein AGMMS50267_01310 [Spirochaetia bacterium]